VATSGLIGLTWTNPCNQPGNEAVGTYTLLPKANGNTSRNITPCTAPDVRTIMPTNTEIQQKHSPKPIDRATAASAGTTPVVIRKPITAPKPSITTHTVRYRMMSAKTEPTSGAAREIGSDRNRSKTPFSMSALRFCPSAIPPIASDWPSMPGSSNSRYTCRSPPLIAPPNR